VKDWRPSRRPQEGPCRRNAPSALWLILCRLLLPLLGPVCCGHDRADSEYLAALAGAKIGVPTEELLPHLDRAIALEAKRAIYWETRGEYRAALHNFVLAKADLDRAIELRDRPYLHFVRGLVLCKSGRCADALSDFDVAIAAQPENTQFYRGRALARVETGMLAAALEDAQRLVERAPQNGESFYPRGVALAALGRLDAAIHDFDETLRLRPDLIYPLLARAACYEILGQTERAAADRKQATVRRPYQGGGCGYCFDPLHF
jgi:tetratricopeptide (TPR) repeat protein